MSVAGDCVEDNEQLSHACSKGRLLGLPRSHKSSIEVPNRRFPPTGDQSGHVELPPYVRASSPDSPASSHGSAVTIERRDSNECRNLLSVCRAELGKARNQPG